MIKIFNILFHDGARFRIISASMQDGLSVIGRMPNEIAQIDIRDAHAFVLESYGEFNSIRAGVPEKPSDQESRPPPDSL